MKIEHYPAWIVPIGSLLVGAIAWSGSMPAIALAILMPIAVSLQKNRITAFLAALGYYAGASWPLIPGAKVFFAANATWLESALLWLSSSFILALPYGVFWMRSIRMRPIGILIALIIVAVPPIGLIGWASPLTAAGVLFPGTAWPGFFALFAVCSFPCFFPRFVAVTAGMLFLFAQAIYHQPPPPSSWQAIDTEFGSGFSSSDPLREFEITETIQGIIRNSENKVLIFPEMIIHRWNDAAAAFWETTLAHLQQKDKTILIGAGLSLSGRPPCYLNGIMILGSHPSPPFIQRIPVPIAMWKPHKPKEGVPLQLLGPGTAIVAGKRAAILICYEQLLISPIWVSAASHPNILIGVANDYWAAGTRIPAVQKSCLCAWARLFRLPVLSAVNR